MFCRTELAESEEFLFLLPSLCPLPHPFLGPLLPEGFASSPEKEAGVQEVWESFTGISYKGDLNLGKQLLVHGDGGQVLALGWGTGKGLPGDRPTASRHSRENWEQRMKQFF